MPPALCERCKETDGRAHNFECLGTVSNTQVQVFYTCPANATEQQNTPQAIEAFAAHFQDTGTSPWIWIFNCQGMKSNDYVHSGAAGKIKEILKQEVFQRCQAVYILQPSTAMKLLVKFILPFTAPTMRSKLHLCSLGPLDIYNRLQKVNVPPPILNSLMQKIQTPIRPQIHS
jgi:hypothetical protein